MAGQVSIKLQGGVCNYLFQIACAYAYSLKNDKELVLTTDDSVVVHKHITNYQNNILSKVKFLPKKDFSGFKLYEEDGFHYTEIPNIEEDVYLHGYFQSELYFKGYEKEIRELFSYPEDQVSAIKTKYKDLFEKNTCSIHIRRGDFLKFPDNHPTQNMNYYMRAVKQMPKDSLFLIFSDDMKWCRENFPDIPEKFIFMEGNSDYEDLLLLSLCDNNIMCNSTFSWWGAWFNENDNKIVLYPKTWFGPAYSNYDLKNLTPDSWIKIQ